MLPNHPYFQKGWHRIDYDTVLAHWIKQTLPEARISVSSPDNSQWLRCGGTWFAGVNVLPNNSAGAVKDGPDLAGAAVEFSLHTMGFQRVNWDSAQVSVCYPGYPQPMSTESTAAFNYRFKCDAAHVDGLLPEGEQRRRHLREHHAFVLGIPMVEASPDASPIVVWEGSHEIVRQTFLHRFQDLEPDRWGDVDVTSIYHEARKAIFSQCPRVEISALPGEAYLIHRLALHGVAPWGKHARSGADGRMVCYFRPELDSPFEWLNLP